MAKKERERRKKRKKLAFYRLLCCFDEETQKSLPTQLNETENNANIASGTGESSILALDACSELQEVTPEKQHGRELEEIRLEEKGRLLETGFEEFTSKPTMSLGAEVTSAWDGSDKTASPYVSYAPVKSIVSEGVLQGLNAYETEISFFDLYQSVGTPVVYYKRKETRQRYAPYDVKYPKDKRRQKKIKEMVDMVTSWQEVQALMDDVSGKKRPARSVRKVQQKPKKGKLVLTKLGIHVAAVLGIFDNIKDGSYPPYLIPRRLVPLPWYRFLGECTRRLLDMMKPGQVACLRTVSAESKAIRKRFTRLQLTVSVPCTSLLYTVLFPKITDEEFRQGMTAFMQKRASFGPYQSTEAPALCKINRVQQRPSPYELEYRKTKCRQANPGCSQADKNLVYAVSSWEEVRHLMMCEKKRLAGSNKAQEKNKVAPKNGPAMKKDGSTINTPESKLFLTEYDIQVASVPVSDDVKDGTNPTCCLPSFRKSRSLLDVFKWGQSIFCDAQTSERGDYFRNCFDRDQTEFLVGALLNQLDCLRQQGIIHGNIDLSNIFFTENGNPFIGGFEKSYSYNGFPVTARADDFEVEYAAPERVEDDMQITPDADLFSVGAVVYQVVTGRNPFHCASVRETVAKIKDRSHRAVCDPDLFGWDLKEVLENCLSKTVRDRTFRGMLVRKSFLKAFPPIDFEKDEPSILLPTLKRIWKSELDLSRTAGNVG